MIKISQKDKEWFYDYLLRYEEVVKKSAGSFDILDSNVVNFFSGKKIYFDSIEKVEKGL